MNRDTLNPLTSYSRQNTLLHTCSSHEGLRQCSLPPLYESPAVEFTDGDRAKCNPISAGINQPALFFVFFGCTICLGQQRIGGRRTMPPNRGDGEGGQIHVKDYKNKTNCDSFFQPSSLFLCQQRRWLLLITHNYMNECQLECRH